MFSHTDILQEFVDASVTITDHSSDWSGRMFRCELEYKIRRLDYKSDPWNRKRERRRDAEARRDPGVQARKKANARAYYVANRDKLLARTRLTNEARLMAKKAMNGQEIVSG